MPKSKYSFGLEGKRFTRWVVISFAYQRAESRKSTAFYWICKCDCGVTRSINVRLLFRGKSTSCGCLKHELNLTRSRIHGHNQSKTVGHSPEYRSWSHMIQRC